MMTCNFGLLASYFPHRRALDAKSLELSSQNPWPNPLSRDVIWTTPYQKIVALFFGSDVALEKKLF